MSGFGKCPETLQEATKRVLSTSWASNPYSTPRSTPTQPPLHNPWGPAAAFGKFPGLQKEAALPEGAGPKRCSSAATRCTGLRDVRVRSCASMLLRSASLLRMIWRRFFSKRLHFSLWAPGGMVRWQRQAFWSFSLMLSGHVFCLLPLLPNSCLKYSIAASLTSSCCFSDAFLCFSSASARNFAAASCAILRILSPRSSLSFSGCGWWISSACRFFSRVCLYLAFEAETAS